MSPALPITKYHQVYLVLREQLQEGRFAQGLPGELALTQQFGVGRVTVRRALEQLAREGLIVREAGRGTRPVARTAARDGGAAGSGDDGGTAHPVSRLTGLLENIVQASRSTTVKVLEWRQIEASDSLAEALQIEPGEAVRKAARCRSAPEGPVSYITTYMPEAMVKGFGRRELALKPILQLLQESGVELGRARQTVSARAAHAQVAKALEVPVGTALLSVRRLVMDADDRPVQLLHGLYRPDRYEYQMELSRVGGIDARIVASEILP
jgi:GntR family transcriptional regulator